MGASHWQLAHSLFRLNSICIEMNQVLWCPELLLFSCKSSQLCTRPDRRGHVQSTNFFSEVKYTSLLGHHKGYAIAISFNSHYNPAEKVANQ